MTEEEVVQKFADTVYRIALIRMKHPGDADDVFQEVFLRYVQSGKQIRDEEHLKAWLIRVTINCCNSAQSNWWRKKVVPLMEYTDLKEPVYEEPGNEIWEALKKLPQKDIDVIHLFYFEGYSIKEISRILHGTETAIKTRLFRARKRLQTILEEGKEG